MGDRRRVGLPTSRARARVRRLTPLTLALALEVGTGSPTRLRSPIHTAKIRSQANANEIYAHP